MRTGSVLEAVGRLIPRARIKSFQVWGEQVGRGGRQVAPDHPFQWFSVSI